MPWKLVYFEEFQTKAEAARCEIAIKKRKSRKYIQSLILKKTTVQSVPSRIPDS
jgi:predicted GIY-YIG superfamily endonuclease